MEMKQGKDVPVFSCDCRAKLAPPFTSKIAEPKGFFAVKKSWLDEVLIYYVVW